MTLSATWAVLVVLEPGSRPASAFPLGALATVGAVVSAALILTARDCGGLGLSASVALVGAVWMVVGSSFGRDMVQESLLVDGCGREVVSYRHDVWLPMLGAGSALVVVAVSMAVTALPRIDGEQPARRWWPASVVWGAALSIATVALVGATRTTPPQRFPSCPRPCASDSLCY